MLPRSSHGPVNMSGLLSTAGESRVSQTVTSKTLDFVQLIPFCSNYFALHRECAFGSEAFLIF